jgi:hypothetical protein
MISYLGRFVLNFSAISGKITIWLILSVDMSEGVRESWQNTEALILGVVVRCFRGQWHWTQWTEWGGLTLVQCEQAPRNRWRPGQNKRQRKGEFSLLEPGPPSPAVAHQNSSFSASELSWDTWTYPLINPLTCIYQSVYPHQSLFEEPWLNTHC